MYEVYGFTGCGDAGPFLTRSKWLARLVGLWKLIRHGPCVEIRIISPAGEHEVW